ncbi:MAG TPA: energy transducer TonB [Pedobacter sp.]|jgi:antitoxin component YwqK of YwqJK toxin-antitoxin module
MKITFLTFFSLLTSICYSQKAQNVYFLKGDEVFVETKGEAEYTRVIQEPDSGSVLYNVLEFYPDNTKKTIGTVSKFEPKLVYEGQVVTFYPNGKKRDVGFYKNGERSGDHFIYYKNGRLKLRESLQKPQSSDPKIPAKSDYRLWDYFDSTGVQIIKDGNGIFKSNKDDSEIIEEGIYKDGLKEGTWIGEYPKYSASFVEKFEKGKLLSGISKLQDGTVTEYTSEDVMPEYKGGIQKFYSYVSRSFIYPPVVLRQGLNGLIIVSFVVEANGSLTDVFVKKDLGFGTGEEAVRLIRSSPRWIPGRQHGIPVRVQYTLPINLKLNADRSLTF